MTPFCHFATFNINCVPIQTLGLSQRKASQTGHFTAHPGRDVRAKRGNFGKGKVSTRGNASCSERALGQEGTRTLIPLKAPEQATPKYVTLA
jgi:hypothetical protein